MQKHVLVLCAAALIGILPTEAMDRNTQGGTGTAGGFVTRLAQVLGQDARDAQSASKALERYGMLPLQDVSSPLTDGLVARIAADLGVAIQTPANPQSTVSSARGAALASLIGMSVLSKNTGLADVEPPTECLRSENRGQCMDCCKEAVGPLPDGAGGTREPGRECAEFCKSNTEPPQSDPEPQP
jgi:hypothetical protein